MIKRIVLTGGPCAGKSTALSKIEDYFLEKGYAVLIIAESATELIHGGIRPFGNQALYGFDFQGIILDYQLNKENTYDQAANYLEAIGRDVIILYDRGLLDNKAYLDLDGWNKLLRTRDLFENDLKEKYDLVIHMVTAACGAKDAYTLQNNQARTETVDEAIKLDNLTKQAWCGHPKLKIVDNSCSFDDKIKNVLEECLAVVGDKTQIRRQRKFLVDPSSLDINKFNSSYTKSVIEQFYFKNENSPYEYRIRRKIIDKKNYYYLTIQEKLDNGKSILISEKKLSEREYLCYLRSNNIVSSINKTRYTFLYDKEYVRLDLFEDGTTLLEIEPMSKSDNIKIPDGINIIEEVTNDVSYQNRELAKVKQKIIQYKKEN